MFGMFTLFHGIPALNTTQLRLFFLGCFFFRTSVCIVSSVRMYAQNPQIKYFQYFPFFFWVTNRTKCSHSGYRT